MVTRQCSVPPSVDAISPVVNGSGSQRLGVSCGETPWLVVLDEPTAALDPLAEQAVYERFIERSAGTYVGPNFTPPVVSPHL